MRIKRRGRHASPSQVEKVAQQAGKAAPAVAIAGALVAAPTAQALASTAAPATAAAQMHETAATIFTEITTTGPAVTGAMLDSFATRSVTVATASTARHAAVAKSTYYTVRSGDSLSTIAQRFYHKAADWQYLYHENEKKIADPESIDAGERLFIPATVPASFKPTAYTPKHAASTPAPSTASSSGSTSSSGSGSGQSSSTPATTDSTVVTQSAPAPQGSYSCSALEQLWDSAGGNPSDAFMAAEIAMAESGGNPNAISPTSDYGLWQINASNGSLATLDPYANAKSAIALSGNGTNWGPWTTYTSGAYSGKC
ncbi:transglycosylase SLT domain-containing protein [Trebonia kvetii]|uniref:transglycosylase SLT domain-containing protein n=1 Tax=Trebonia kvetii TaxID=2480626 RepID=UPI0016525563|nr:transglycosylase SLT domain-containing protein [Trebonia kvetii]